MVSEARRPYPLFNTTFTLHRLSPLYTNRSNPLDVASLQHYAHLFRDLLAGDVLRGVRVGLGANEDVLARVGALQTVSWRLLPEEELWNADEQTQLESTTTSSTSSSRGVLISVTYEKAAYMAILLAEKDRIESSTDGKEGFQSFPLLLTRMPGSLRDRFTEFLASTFDTRVSALYLGRSYMTMALEDYISNSAMEEGGEPLDQPQISRTLRSIIKELQVVIGFDLPGGSPSLRTIDIVIAREDFPRLVQSGQRIAKQTSIQESPLISALANYVNAHLALNIMHERVKILKIACGAFVLGAEGKAKLTEPVVHDESDTQNRATWKLINGLIDLAKGGVMSKVTPR